MKIHNETSSYVKSNMESLFETWERLKDLLVRCPQRRFLDWMIVHTFYNVLNPSTLQLLDAATGGTSGNKTPEAALQLIEDMAMNNNQ